MIIRHLHNEVLSQGLEIFSSIWYSNKHLKHTRQNIKFCYSYLHAVRISFLSVYKDIHVTLRQNLIFSSFQQLLNLCNQTNCEGDKLKINLVLYHVYLTTKNLNNFCQFVHMLVNSLVYLTNRLGG